MVQRKVWNSPGGWNNIYTVGPGIHPKLSPDCYILLSWFVAKEEKGTRIDCLIML